MSNNGGKKTGSFRSFSFRRSKNKKKPPLSNDTVDGRKARLQARHSVPDFTNNNNVASQLAPLCTAVAVQPFTGILPCDLSFNVGDRIDILTRTDKRFDWWEGRLVTGRTGLFPANFVKIMN